MLIDSLTAILCRNRHLSSESKRVVPIRHVVRPVVCVVDIH
jgi:hypothetical protein